jgi:PAS domain S-box-containing protein
MVVGVQHIVRYANPAFCRLVGKPEESVLGMFAGDCLPQCAGCIALLTQVNRTGEAKSHTEHGTALRKPLSWSYSVWPIVTSEGQKLGAMLQVTEASQLQSQSTAMNEALMVSAVRQHELAAAADVLAVEMGHEIVRREQSEGALAFTEARLRLALESAKASTWEWNIKTNTLLWSDEISTLPGLEVVNREESYESWRAFVHPEDREALDRAAEQAATSIPQIALEFRTLDLSGAIHWMLLRGCVGRVEDGCAISYLGILLDVTERKHAEHALLRSEKLAGVGRLAATLAHEINNPLDAAMNALYLAQTNPDVPESALEYLAMADEELRRVAHMTRQSLGFYREATSPTTFAVDTLLDSVLGLMKNRIIAKSITIDRQSDKTLEVTGIFGELRQVMVNLVANSVDAIDTGGLIKLRASVSSSSKNGGQRHIRITVADNGRGIGASQLTRVFEPFFTTKGELGTGLGLWVTKQIVEKHSGGIRVRSSTDRRHNGTVFSVTLPE